jgi:hypothetical protein
VFLSDFSVGLKNIASHLLDPALHYIALVCSRTGKTTVQELFFFRIIPDRNEVYDLIFRRSQNPSSV